jgi:hypothetical protein
MQTWPLGQSLWPFGQNAVCPQNATNAPQKQPLASALTQQLQTPPEFWQSVAASHGELVLHVLQPFAVHTPLTQKGVAEPQTVPHAPQLLGSLWRWTHVPTHDVWPAGQHAFTCVPSVEGVAQDASPQGFPAGQHVRLETVPQLV